MEDSEGGGGEHVDTEYVNEVLKNQNLKLKVSPGRNNAGISNRDTDQRSIQNSSFLGLSGGNLATSGHGTRKEYQPFILSMSNGAGQELL